MNTRILCFRILGTIFLVASLIVTQGRAQTVQPMEVVPISQEQKIINAFVNNDQVSINFFLSDPASAQIITNKGTILMYWAAYWGNVDVAQRLIDSFGFDVTVKSGVGAGSSYNPLNIAAAKRQTAMVRFLVAKKALLEPNQTKTLTPLHFAVELGDVDLVKNLLALGASPNARAGWSATPLHTAAEQGNVIIGGILIDAGADVNAYGTYFQVTPVGTAAMNGHSDMVNLLLSRRADPNAPSWLGLRPEHMAAMNNHMNIVKILFTFQWHDATMSLANAIQLAKNVLIIKQTDAAFPATSVDLVKAMIANLQNAPNSIGLDMGALTLQPVKPVETSVRVKPVVPAATAPSVQATSLKPSTVTQPKKTVTTRKASTTTRARVAGRKR